MTWCSPRMRSAPVRRSVAADEGERGAGCRGRDVVGAQVGTLGSSPNQTTRAAVMRRHRRDAASSAFSTATAVAGRSVTISAFARCVASMPPNSPAWARPTLSTTRYPAARSRPACAISPTPLAPISTTRYSVSSSIPSIVIGAPTWLLNEPRGATVGALALEDRAQQVLGRGLAVRAGDRRRPAARPRARTRATTIRARAAERDHAVRRRRAAAPASVERALDDHQRARRPRRQPRRRGARRSSRRAARRRSSRRRPGGSRSARDPATTSSRRCPSGSTSAPSSASAISARVSAITSPARLAQRRARLCRGRSTACARRGCRGSPGGPGPPRGSSRPRAASDTALRIAASGGLTS